MQNFCKGQDIVTLKKNHLRHPTKHSISPKATLPFPRVHVHKHEHRTNNQTEFMSAAVTALLTLKGHMHTNNVLTEAVGHTCGSLLPLPYVQSQITTSRKYHMPSHSTAPLHNRTTATRVAQTLLPTGWRELDEILCTVTGLWEERKDWVFLLLKTGCFCNTALIQEENTHNSIILAIQICKDVNRCSPYTGLETNPKYFWVQSSWLWVQPVLAVPRFLCHQNYLIRGQSTQVAI